MSPGRRSRRRETRYYILRAAEEPAEIARVSPRGAPSLYDPVTSSWIPDPLLGAEIHLSDEWVLAATADLPDGVGPISSTDEAAYPAGRRRRRRRRPWTL